MKRTYSELIRFKSFDDRFKYLMNCGRIGDFTHNDYRYFNQKFYTSKEWKTVRRNIILRDRGFDLAHTDHLIFVAPQVHHINPLSIQDLIDHNVEALFDPENLITIDPDTHKAVEFGSLDYLSKFKSTERFLNDTAPWRL